MEWWCCWSASAAPAAIGHAGGRIRQRTYKCDFRAQSTQVGAALRRGCPGRAPVLPVRRCRACQQHGILHNTHFADFTSGQRSLSPAFRGWTSCGPAPGCQINLAAASTGSRPRPEWTRCPPFREGTVANGQLEHIYTFTSQLNAPGGGGRQFEAPLAEGPLCTVDGWSAALASWAAASPIVHRGRRRAPQLHACHTRAAGCQRRGLPWSAGRSHDAVTPAVAAVPPWE